MEILLWVVAWLLAGCGVAWMIGSAASMSDPPVGNHAPRQDAIEDFDHFLLSKNAQRDFGAESGAAAQIRADCVEPRHTAAILTKELENLP